MASGDKTLRRNRRLDMWNKIKRLLRYYQMGFIVDLKANIAYPTTFWFASMVIPMWILIQILFIETIYGQTDSFLGYSRYENYVLFGTFKLVQSLAAVFFMEKLEDLTEKIRGTSDNSFDVLLLKPMDSQVLATTGSFWFGSISSAVAGLGMVLYGLSRESHVLGFGNILTYGIAVVMGVFFLYLLYFFIQTWLFWFEYLQVGQELWFTLQGFGQFPRSLYSGWSAALFNIAMPITLMAGIPVEFLFGQIPSTTLLLYCGILILLFVLTRLFWQYSIKKYSSFSS